MAMEKTSILPGDTSTQRVECSFSAETWISGLCVEPQNKKMEGNSLKKDTTAAKATDGKTGGESGVDFLGLFFVSPSLGCQTWRCQSSKNPFIWYVWKTCVCIFILYIYVYVFIFTFHWYILISYDGPGGWVEGQSWNLLRASNLCLV